MKSDGCFCPIACGAQHECFVGFDGNQQVRFPSGNLCVLLYVCMYVCMYLCMYV